MPGVLGGCSQSPTYWRRACWPMVRPSASSGVWTTGMRWPRRWALRNRLPRVAEVFAAGRVSYRQVNAIAYRTALIRDPDARAKVDTDLAAAAVDWGSLSVAK